MRGRVTLYRWERNKVSDPQYGQELYPDPLTPPESSPLPGPVPLSWQHWEEQDEAAREVQTRGAT